MPTVPVSIGPPIAFKRGMPLYDELPEKATQQFLNDGYYCSEAILRTYNQALELGLNEAGLRMATAFGVGFGGAKCCCGALTGALMVLSARGGRTTSGESERELFVHTAKLHDGFKAQFKATCCRNLTRKVEWGTEAHTQYCAKFVRGAAELLNTALVEMELERSDPDTT